MGKYISNIIETENLLIKDATLSECDELQNICYTWEDKSLFEGEDFVSDYIFKCLTEGDLPPIQNATKEKYSLKSIHLKRNNTIIGFMDIYHGYPNEYTVWISIFVLHKDVQDKGIGQEVIRVIAENALEIAYKKMGIAVHLKNWKALRFWTKAGFDRVIGIYGDKTYGQDKFSIIGLEKSIIEMY